MDDIENAINAENATEETNEVTMEELGALVHEDALTNEGALIHKGANLEEPAVHEAESEHEMTVEEMLDEFMELLNQAYLPGYGNEVNTAFFEGGRLDSENSTEDATLIYDAQDGATPLIGILSNASE